MLRKHFEHMLSMGLGFINKTFAKYFMYISIS